jgi:hypothetical protein
MGRGGDPGIPGVRQGGGAGDPGSGERVHQRGTIGSFIVSQSVKLRT